MALPKFDPGFAQPSDWAEMYRACGLQIVPSIEKRPRLQTWTELQNELAPDFVFARWYGPSGEFIAHSGMGILTGKCSGDTIVVDLDTHKTPAAAAWWSDLIDAENNGIDIETPEQITGGGGRQKLFRVPAGRYVASIRTSIGIDIRGTGGFAVMPPSLHASGKRYEWLTAPWEIEIAMAPPWLLEAIDHLAHSHGDAAPRAERTASPETDFTAFGSRQDGREQEMYRAVWRAVLEMFRQSPIKPVAWINEEREAYAAYEAKVVSRLSGADKTADLDREGRGPKEFARKWRREMRNWGSPKMLREAARPNPNQQQTFDAKDFEQATGKAEERAKETPGAQFEMLDPDQIFAMTDPKWLVSGLIAEQSMGFIYGPPGCLKTFIGLDMALSFATGLTQWWGRDITHNGTVIYISAEGQADLKFRLAAWQQHRNTPLSAKTPFRLIRESIDFMKADDLGKLLATVQSAVDQTGQKVAAVFVDTVSRVLPGADENLQKDMTLFVRACDLLRIKFSACVVGIHHTSKAGPMRGSTVMPGAGDFIVEVQREAGAAGGIIRAAKIKAAQDGWEQAFSVKEIAIGVSGKTSLCVDAAAEQPRGESGLPDRETCRAILAALHEQWLKKQPWSRAANSARPAVKQIIIRWKIKREIAQRLIDHWVAQGLIDEAIYDTRTGQRGYCKLADL